MALYFGFELSQTLYLKDKNKKINLPARWSGLNLRRPVLEHDGDSSLRLTEEPKKNKSRAMKRADGPTGVI